MFDLEQAIAQWRGRMAADGIKSPEVLDELESHLREDVREQMHLGLDGQQGFDAAVRRIGENKALRREFSKANRHGVRLDIIALNILAGWFILMGLNGLILPAIHQILNFADAVMLAFDQLWGSYRYADIVPNFFRGIAYQFLSINLAFNLLLVLMGIGLLRRWNFCRIVALVWCVWACTGAIAYLLGYSPGPHVYIPPPGMIVTYHFLGLPVPYGVFHAIFFIRLPMMVMGLFILARRPVRDLFRPVPAN